PGGGPARERAGSVDPKDDPNGNNGRPHDRTDSPGKPAISSSGHFAERNGHATNRDNPGPIGHGGHNPADRPRITGPAPKSSLAGDGDKRNSARPCQGLPR